ncbi:hypothetical protein JCM19992_17120 [Thermostilla marina]
MAPRTRYTASTEIRFRDPDNAKQGAEILVREALDPLARAELRLVAALEHDNGVTRIATSAEESTSKSVRQPRGVLLTDAAEPIEVPSLALVASDGVLMPIPDFATHPPVASSMDGEPASSASPSDVSVDAYGCDSCGTPSCTSCGSCGGLFSDWLPCNPCRPSDPWKLRTPGFLACRGWEIGGWIDAGISAVANNPADRYNGVVTFNDRDGEGQLNQLWFYLNKDVDTDACGFSYGGRLDFVYGTDARFTQAVDGLEADWDQTEPFYQAALPQFYLDVAYNGWVVRMGHFYTTIGYEVVAAPDNFFYSHAYTMQYGEPFTHTGLLLMRELGGGFAFSAGLQRGNDQFDDTDGLDALGFLGGVSWTSCDERLSVAFNISADEAGPDQPVTIYSLVGNWQVTDNLEYVIQHDWGNQEWANGGSSQWYGLNQYFLYTINDCWKAGMRVEWFHDGDGVRVSGLGVGNQTAGSFPGDFYEITAGLNWTPHPNLIVRPELRWDWYEADGAVASYPYDAGDLDHQFIFGCDMIVTF